MAAVGDGERVLAARRQSPGGVGARSKQPGPLCGATEASDPTPNARGPVFAAIHPSEQSVRVLSFGEAAARLGLSRAQLEAMIAAGKVEALFTGFTMMIPTGEVKRLLCGVNNA